MKNRGINPCIILIAILALGYSAGCNNNSDCVFPSADGDADTITELDTSDISDTYDAPEHADDTESTDIPADSECSADVSSDPNNCGYCGHVCPHVPHAFAECDNGACAYRCESNWDDCNGDIDNNDSDGCESNLTSDALHCSQCNNSCPVDAANAQAACIDSQCRVTCMEGYLDCNGDLLEAGGNGCEINALQDADNCGDCGHACNSGQCNQGYCEGEASACVLHRNSIVKPNGVRLAGDGSGFIAVWQEFDEDGLFAAALDLQGNPLGAAVKVAAAKSWHRYDLGHDGSRYVLVWDNDEEVQAIHINSDGSTTGAAISLIPGHDAYSIRVVSAEDRIVAIADNTLVELPADTQTPTATVSTGEPYTLTGACTCGAAIDDNLLIGHVYTEQRGEPVPYTWFGLLAGTYGLGSAQSPAISDLGFGWSDSMEHCPSLTTGGNGFVMAVISGSELTTLTFDATGQPTGGESPQWQSTGVFGPRFMVSGGGTHPVIMGSNAGGEVVAMFMSNQGTISGQPVVISAADPIWPHSSGNTTMAAAPDSEGGYLLMWHAQNDVQGDWLAYAKLTAQGEVILPCQQSD